MERHGYTDPGSQNFELMCKNKGKSAHAYNCEHMMIIYTEIRNDMNKINK